MRTIKFRGQRLNSDYWEYGYLFINEHSNAFIENLNWKREPIKKETVGEFTGLIHTCVHVGLWELCLAPETTYAS